MQASPLETLHQGGNEKRGGKSTGPDGISYEALKVIMRRHEHWETQIRAELKDALYNNGRMSRCAKDSTTILLPKERQPSDWGRTRPITLSSSRLQWQSQLILGRVAG